MLSIERVKWFVRVRCGQVAFVALHQSNPLFPGGYEKNPEASYRSALAVALFRVGA